MQILLFKATSCLSFSNTRLSVISVSIHQLELSGKVMGREKTKILPVIRSTFSRFFRDDCSRLAAALSFYTLFSLAPLFLIIVAIVGFVYGTEAIQGNIVKRLSAFLGEKSALLIQDLIVSISRPSSSFIASAVAVFLSLYGASHIFNHLNVSINRIWNISVGSGINLRYLLISYCL